MIKWGLSQECKDSSIYANQSMWYTILTHWRRKTIWSSQKTQKKLSTKFNIHDVEQTGDKRTYVNIIKAVYDKLTANIILNGEKMKVFPLRSETRQGCPLSPLLLNIVLKVLARAVRQEKEIKDIQIQRKK